MGILYQLKKRVGLNKLAIFWVLRVWENQIEPGSLEMFKEEGEDTGMQSHLSNVNVIVFSTREEVLFILRRNIYAQTHQHHALQVTLALEGTLELVVDKQKTEYRAVVIDRDYPHLVKGQAGWVATLLVNPESSIARGIQRHLLRDAHSASAEEAFSDGLIEQLTTLMQQPFTNKRLETMLAKMLSFMPDRSDDCSALDTRIAEALDLVKRTEGRRLTAQELSEAVFLSEGRFGHLFREEIGLPMRRYLLWCRLMDALKHIGQGERFTFAAHEAGFSDAAHLSRTFRQTFGISLSEMFGKTGQISLARQTCTTRYISSPQGPIMLFNKLT